MGQDSNPAALLNNWFVAAFETSEAAEEAKALWLRAVGADRFSATVIESAVAK